MTNGLGGYASGTIACIPTRRFHGYLIAALPPPQGRVLLLNALEETCNGQRLCTEETLDELRLEDGLPVWTHAAVEKRVVLESGRNTAVVTWRALRPATLVVRPAFQLRTHEGLVAQAAQPVVARLLRAGAADAGDGADDPPLRCEVNGAVRLTATRGAWSAVEPAEVRTVRYPVEEDRGYDHEGPLTTPCALTVELRAGEEVSLVVSAISASGAAPAFGSEPASALASASASAPAPEPDPAEIVRAEATRRAALLAAAPAAAQHGLAAELVLAADQFVVRKVSAPGDDDARTVIAGYHWFTDWGRDTMISLEGLCLSTGRDKQAARILRTFATHVRDGLIPNLFPEGEAEGLYHTADATLWFFHAVDRYVQVSGDDGLLRELLPVFRDILRYHLAGTRFGIGVDPADGLLRQGEAGYQLTWMDAKVDGWVVTPRRGKAVELNALFYNALVLFDRWSGGDALIAAHAARLRQSFNGRFYDAGRGHLYDVLDPDDASLRPNQVFAISLPNPVLDQALWEPVLRSIELELLTPVGLRSLGPREPAYTPWYRGDLRNRDAAYHQGTVWGWLIGPFVDAWRKVHPGRDARPLLAGFDAHLGAFGLGSIAEIFDGDAPHTPRGCVAQAWSVAEVLRCLSTPSP